MLKRLFRQSLRRRGWELKPIGAPVRGYDNFIAMLVSRGFRPGTVIDVGVATGTPWLYGKFAGSKLVLVEPNPRFAGTLQELATAWGADVHNVAVGEAAGELVLHEDEKSPSSSSIHSVGAARREAMNSGKRTYSDVRIAVRTLDDVIDHRYPSPYLLKIDTEGFECSVIAGARQVLTQSAVVIAEASVAQRFAGSYSFADLVAAMDANGFRLFDILKVKSLGPGGPINYMDAAFIRADWEKELGV
jgi:FkbM family methyltransferase